MVSEEEIRLGKEAEEKFEQYLRGVGINPINVRQDIEYSQSLRALFPYKRPDFIILNPYRRASTIIEVKHRIVGYGRLTVNLDEAEKFEANQKLINNPFWFAISNYKINYKTWFWILAPEALKKGSLRTNKDENSKFLSISLENFITTDTKEYPSKILLSDF